MLGQGVLQKHINKQPSNTSLIRSHILGQGVLQKHIGQGVLRRHSSKEPSNALLMCSPLFGQGVLQECGKHISESHFTNLTLKQQLPGQYDNFFFTMRSIESFVCAYVWSIYRISSASMIQQLKRFQSTYHIRTICIHVLQYNIFKWPAILMRCKSDAAAREGDQASATLTDESRHVSRPPISYTVAGEGEG